MPRYKRYSELTFFEKLSIDFNKDGYEEARRKAENDDDCAYCIFSLIKCFCILSIFAIIIVSFFSPYFRQHLKPRKFNFFAPKNRKKKGYCKDFCTHLRKMYFSAVQRELKRPF